jgi:large subunit ribosomal protein L9
MEVILMEDVDRVGHEGDILKVADGFARNYLIPRGFAVHANKGALNNLDRRRKAIEAREDTKRAKFRVVADQLNGQSVTVKARAGQGARLHGQVTPQMIAEAVKEQLHMDLDKRNIEIAEPIRELGDYLVGARLYKDVHAQLPVSVLRDAGEEDYWLPMARAKEEENAKAAAAAAEAEAAGPAAAEEAEDAELDESAPDADA